MEEHPNPRKGGRPPIPNKLDKTIRVRITSDDYHRCKKIAEEANMNVTEYFRKMMTEGKVTNLFSAEGKREKIQLAGMANNLNQLVKEAHTFCECFYLFCRRWLWSMANCCRLTNRRGGYSSTFCHVNHKITYSKNVYCRWYRL